MKARYLQSLEACSPDTTVPMRRGRFFVLGEGRVGKTTLLKALKREPFDPKEESTQVRQLTQR